jgi:predicted Zn-dependent protease
MSFSKVCFLGFLPIILTSCVTTEYNVGTHTQDIYFYSTEREVALGKNISRQVPKHFEISQNPFYIERVRTIGEKVAAVCDRKELNYYFDVIDDDEKNAFSLPGGFIYIHRGLLDILESDDEVAFVLAHEVAHIVARHSIKKLQAAMGYNLLMIATIPAEKSPQFHQGLSFALAQIMVAYSRIDEFDADELATKYAQLAGYDPLAGITVAEKLYQHHKEEEARPITYFRTHPYPVQRITHIKEVLGIPLTISDYINE